MIGSTYLHTTIIGVATALLLSGCVTDGNEAGTIVAKPVLNPTPVSFETKMTGTRSGTTPVITNGLQSQQSALLEAPIQPVMEIRNTKVASLASLADGRLTGAEIKSLFSGLEVQTPGAYSIRHWYRDNGRLDGLSGGGGGGTRAVILGSTAEDFGDWKVTKSATLCTDWFDWYSGDENCFAVSKQGSQLILTGDRYSMHYKITNRR